MNNEIGVSFQLPGVEKILTATGKEKYIKEDTDNVSIGVEFNNMDYETPFDKLQKVTELLS